MWKEVSSDRVIPFDLSHDPDTRETTVCGERVRDNLGVALIDLAEAVGWLDLAVIDGTYIYGSEWKEGVPQERERRDLLMVGRDPVAVETVGSLLAGLLSLITAIIGIHWKSV